MWQQVKEWLPLTAVILSLLAIVLDWYHDRSTRHHLRESLTQQERALQQQGQALQQQAAALQQQEEALRAEIDKLKPKVVVRGRVLNNRVLQITALSSSQVPVYCKAIVCARSGQEAYLRVLQDRILKVVSRAE